MKIKIKVGGIEMTPNEARDVYIELKRLFDGQETAPYYIPYSPYTVPASSWQP